MCNLIEKTIMKKALFFCGALVFNAFVSNAQSWQFVGNPGFSLVGVSSLDMEFDNNGTPYVAYIENISTRAVVRKFDGNDWVLVGDSAFSPVSAAYISLAFNSAGVPYVAYADGNNSGKLNVLKFNGSNWVYVGIAGVSAGAVEFVDLAFNSNDEP